MGSLQVDTATLTLILALHTTPYTYTLHPNPMPHSLHLKCCTSSAGYTIAALYLPYLIPPTLSDMTYII